MKKGDIIKISLDDLIYIVLSEENDEKINLFNIDYQVFRTLDKTEMKIKNLRKISYLKEQEFEMNDCMCRGWIVSINGYRAKVLVWLPEIKSYDLQEINFMSDF